MKNLKRLLEISEKTNIAEELNDQTLSKIGGLCKAGYDEDLTTCEPHFKKLEEYIEIAKQVVQEKTYPWVGAANAKYPLLTVASMQFNARALPALVPPGKVVKARAFGEDPNQEKEKRAARISDHMSYQLKYSVDDWEENMDAMLLQLPIVGMMFKKTYRDTIKRRNSSSLLMPNQLVVNNDTTRTIETCPRATEILSRYPHQIKGNIEAGLWIDAEIVLKDEENEALENILEQHVIMDVYGTGDKEPYIITIHEETGKILRIKAGFDEDTIFIEHNGDYKSYGEVRRSIDNQNAQTMARNRESVELATGVGEIGMEINPIPDLNTEGIKPLCIEKLKYYTEFFYLPSFDGKYYKAGLGDLIASLSGLIDTNLNQMLDAGTLANLQAGLQHKRGKGPAGKISLKPGQFAPIDTGGLPIRDSIYTFDFKGPSSVLFSLLGMLIEAARDITSIKDIMVGEAPQGETATTTMIKQKEGMRVFTAIYQRLYRSLSKEFKKLYTLNRKYLKQGEYFRFGDSQSYIQKADYEDDSLDVIPVADPNESTLQERVLKAQGLMAFIGDPDADPVAIKKNYITAMGIDESQYEVFFPGPKPSSPAPEQLKIMAESKKIEEEILQMRYENTLTAAKTIEALANAESKELGPQIEMYKQQYEELMNGIQSGGATGGIQNTADEGGIPQESPIVGGPGEGNLLAQGLVQ